METLDRTTLLGHFEKRAFEVTGERFVDTDEKADISALGMDSVALLEVVASLEEQLDIYLADEVLARVETVGDLIDAVLAAPPA